MDKGGVCLALCDFCGRNESGAGSSGFFVDNVRVWQALWDFWLKK